MAKRGVLLASFLALLLVVASSVKTDKVARVIGVAKCSDCTEKNINSFKGLHVAVLCKSGNKYYEPEGLSQMTKEGRFNLDIRTSLLKEDGSGLKSQCYAQLYSSSKNAPCPTQSHSDHYKLVLSGKSQGVHVFGVAGGKLSFSRAACGEKTFWPNPFFKLPPLHPWKNHFPKFPCPKPTPPPSPKPTPPETPTPPESPTPPTAPTPPTYTPKPTPPTYKPPKPTPPTYTPKPTPPTYTPKPTPPTYTPKPKPPTHTPPTYTPKPTPPTYTPKPKPPTYTPPTYTPKPTPPTYTPKPKPPTYTPPTYTPKPTPPTYTPKPKPPTYTPPTYTPKPTPPTYTPKPKPPTYTPPTYTPKPTPPTYTPPTYTPKPTPPTYIPPVTPSSPPIKPKFPWHHFPKGIPGFPPSSGH